MGEYLEEVFARIDLLARAGSLEGVETVYVGGGTPSLLGEGLVELVGRIRSVCSPLEFSCEANPESFTADLARRLVRAGLTRVSLGVQTLDAVELKTIGRVHTAARALDALEAAAAAGLDVSCDLMCGLPGQTLASFERSLSGVLSCPVGHVSVYPLSIEEGTALDRMIERGLVEGPDEDLQADCMELAAARLREAGFERYEVASYARSGRACRHNIAYWTGTSYVGVGRAAASMLSADDLLACAALFPAVSVPTRGRVRIVQLDDSAHDFDFEVLSESEALAEDLMLACRMSAGIPRTLLNRARTLFGASRVDGQMAFLEGEGLLKKGVSGGLAPTERGWLMGNELFGAMWDLHCS